MQDKGCMVTAWRIPKGVDIAQKAIHNALVVHQAYTRGTPCKTKVAMVTTWHTPEGVT